MSLEQELLDATGVEPGEFKNRRKMLEAIIRVVNKLPEDGYDGLSDEAINWYEAGVRAMNSKKAPPDFEAAPPKPEPDEGEGEDEGDEDIGDVDEGDEDDEGPDEGEEGQEAQTSAPNERFADSDTAIEEPVHEPGEVEEAPAPKKQKKVKKAKAPKPPTKAELERAAGGPTRYEKMIKYGGTKNRYGIYEGTKAHDTILMLEKGTTMAEIKNAVGDTKYNLVKALQKAGHLIEKEDNKFTLTHKADIGKKPKGKKK